MNNTEHSAPRGDDSGRAQVFRAAGLVASLALLSRVLGLAREIVVRQYLGVTTLEATAFDIAGRFPDAIFLIVAGGASGSGFIPTFTAYFSRDDEPGGWQLFSAVINRVTVVTTGISVLVMTAAAPFPPLPDGFKEKELPVLVRFRLQ